MNILANPPNVHPITSIPLTEPRVYQLDNGAVLHELRMGSQDILKIEWLFDAGRWYETGALVARAAAQLLRSGTQNYNADELADFFDFYGAKLKISDDFDVVSIRLYCLTKHLETLLPRVEELLLEPAYEQGEIDNFAQRSKQALRLQLQRNEVLAYRKFTEQLFGNIHPYGYNSSPKHYDSLNRESLFEHHRRCYHAKSCQLIVGGKTNDRIIQLLQDHLNKLPKYQHPKKIVIPPYPMEVPQTVHYPGRKNATQASIRIGARMIDWHHPDYPAFYLTNTLLGGYFGARLMQNLREDKGYTYSIYSSSETLRHGGYFYIYTDVNSNVKEAALREIYKELTRLQEEPVPEAELNMLRNYCMGMFLHAVDGVFNVSSVIREIIQDGLTVDYYNKFVETIATITAEEIQTVARRYFKRTELCEVVVG